MSEAGITDEARLTAAAANPSPRAGSQSAHPLASTVVLGFGLFLVVFDSLSVATALPSIRADLNLRTTELQWIVNMYSLSIAGLLLAGGRAADLFGRRRILLGSLAILALGTTVAGLAPTLATLLIGRALQGIAAACALPAALALTGSLFPDEPWRSRAFAIMSVAGGTAGLAGAILGGLLTDAFGWRWIFLATVPLSVLAILTARHYLPVAAKQPNPGLKRLDLPAAALGTAGLLAVVFGFGHIEAAGGLGAATVLGPLVVGAALLASFLIWERHTPDPLVDLHLLRSRRLAGSCTGIAAQSCVHTAVVVVGSLQLQSVHGMSATGAGLALSPALAATSLGSVVAGRALPRLGARRIAILTLPVAALAMAGLAAGARSSNYALAVLPWFVLQGLFNSATYVALSSEAVGEAAEEASDTSVNQSIDEAIGAAVVASVRHAPEPLDEAAAVAVVESIEQAVDEAVHEAAAAAQDPEATEAAPPAAVPRVAAAVEAAVRQTLVERQADETGLGVSGHTLVAMLDDAERAAESAAEESDQAVVAHGVAAGLFETSTHVGGALAVAVLISLASSGVSFTGAYSAAAALVVSAWIAVLILVPGRRDRRSRARVWSLVALRRRRLVIRAAQRLLASRSGRGGVR